MDPWLGSVVPPLWEDGRLEYERIRDEEPLEPSGPGVAVDVQNEPEVAFAVKSGNVAVGELLADRIA